MKPCKTKPDERVIEHLKSNGYSVVALGLGGLPDLLVAKDKFSALVVVKRDRPKPRGPRFRDTWMGVVITALNADHALTQLEAWRAWVCK